MYEGARVQARAFSELRSARRVHVSAAKPILSVQGANVYRSNGDECKICRCPFKKAWEIAKLKNLFLITSMTNDTEWQHELCARIGKIER
ncbi:hypothetical protein C4A75_03795 [Brevibacillus laterosporus]|nr:hypothetical protein [Brevibacillus laterosporus]MBG9798341.1 hypothetical protein [Brevibacillus laterosporus]PPA87103.1 hypothetical protein C4A75_03795 [Brevibacillus laterosporus]